jgi:serralysin
MLQSRFHFIESLESRRLLTAQVVLQIIGTDASDLIVVAQSGNTITVTENSGTPQVFQVGQISRVSIASGSGNDRIDCTTLKVRLSASGENGDDTIIGSEASDRIDGGDGEDSILGGKGSDKIRGQDENDTVRGGKGNDTVEGNEGEDFITGDEGNDLLNANDDLFEDTVSGGTGIDIAEVDDELGITDDVDNTVETVNE